MGEKLPGAFEAWRLIVKLAAGGAGARPQAPWHLQPAISVRAHQTKGHGGLPSCCDTGMGLRRQARRRLQSPSAANAPRRTRRRRREVLRGAEGPSNHRQIGAQGQIDGADAHRPLALATEISVS